MGSQHLHSRLLLLACVLCGCLAVEGCLEKERRALLQLREAFFYPAAVNLSEWPSWVGNDCCSWEYVSCVGGTPPLRVRAILLSSRRRERLGAWKVNGSLFAPLEELQQLELSGNQISGWLEPEGLLGLRKLRTISLGENLLTDDSISWLFDLPSLAEVDLSYNKLSRPSTLKGFCGLKNLTSLNLGWNKIVGSIDPCISSMQSLQELYLGGNRFGGGVPFLGNLSSLRAISLGENMLSGVFYFSSIANLANLTAVALADNRDLEVETEHPPWVPSFQLRGLILRDCAVNRRSGRRIPSFLSTQKNMAVLALSRTSIRGTMPPWLFDNVEQILILDGNSLSGPFPRLDGNRTRGISLLDLAENRIDGPMPPNMSALFPQLYHLNLSWNAFRGGMASFGQLGYLGVLDLSHNGLTGEIPAELMANGSRLSHLRLSHNHLEGSMLPRGAGMRLLTYLILEGNRFSGAISPDLSNFPSLIILNLRRNRLSGAMPREMFALPNLAAVLLAGNRFQGRIPAQLCRMQGLRMLDLSENSFSGAIPSCLSNVTSWRMNSKAFFNNFYSRETVEVEFWTKGRLRKLQDDELSWFTGIDLSRNRLTGGIPVELGAMGALRSLNISRNRLSGGIPSSFQGLERVESMDLSHNELSGSIPPVIARLPHLSVFCVAYNKLTGSIPFVCP